MGFFDSFVKEVFDDALGFVDVKKAAPVPATPAVVQPTPNMPAAQPTSTTVDPVQSYLATQRAKWFNDQLRNLTQQDVETWPGKVLGYEEPTEFWGQVTLYGGLILVGYFIFKALK